MERHGVAHKFTSPFVSGVLGVTLWFAGAEVVAAGVVTRVLPSDDAIELEIPTDIGPQRETIPLYHSGKIRYFSAGIGQVEREAIYPPFSLKLVFTAGGKPFVTGVALSLRNAKGTTLLTVPGDQVAGPWLFVDLPEGTYEVTATLGGQQQQVKGITIKRGRVTTQHVRWAEDRSPPLAATAE
ncbi:MAG: hypothetical protein OJF52_003272 [Nitrospira sp.]|jgi:hypothetical protein|nr:MAG: hypothetical protein OJF52_003272 [Nitrospira sp.]